MLTFCRLTYDERRYTQNVCSNPKSKSFIEICYMQVSRSTEISTFIKDSKTPSIELNITQRYASSITRFVFLT